MIQNGIARFDVAQQIDQRNLVRLRTRQCAHDEVEIGCGKPRPTIRSNHRDFILNSSLADSKHLLDSFSCLKTAADPPALTSLRISYGQSRSSGVASTAAATLSCLLIVEFPGRVAALDPLRKATAT